MGGHGLQEAVAPQEGGVLAHSTANGRLTDGEAVDERLGIIFPARGLAQSGQGGVGEDRTGAQTQFAAVATQSSAPTPGAKLAASAWQWGQQLEVGNWVAREVMGWGAVSSC